MERPKIDGFHSKWIKGTELEIIRAGHSVERSKGDHLCTCQCLFSVHQGNRTTLERNHTHQMNDASVLKTSLTCEHLVYLVRAMWDTERNIWQWKLILRAEVMYWNVSLNECDVLHPKQTIMQVQMEKGKVSHELLTWFCLLGVSIWSPLFMNEEVLAHLWIHFFFINTLFPLILLPLLFYSVLFFFCPSSKEKQWYLFIQEHISKNIIQM